MSHRICQYAECNQPFVPRRRDQRYCGRVCKDRAHSIRQREAIKTAPPCVIDGCCRQRKSGGRGYCDLHYRRKLRGTPMNAPEYRGRLGVAPCSVDGCTRKYNSNGLCELHYRRKRDTGSVGPPGLKRRPNGSRWLDTWTGYVYVSGKLEHRIVIEQHLDRPLLSDESVHHKNGDRGDNHIDNLELWSRFQPRGQRVVDKLAYAREIVARYSDLPPEVT